jgi:argininosuccinate lyase
MVFDPEYVSRVLRENFEDAKVLFLSPLVAINYAHLLMLREQGIVTAADARAMRDALDSISIADVRSAQ